ncbi:MAG: PIN domain-containing protein [Candidatus Aenigmatarchaeota archaeon]
MTEYLLDTWAWIEFYIGSEKGKKVYELLESSEKCFTSMVTVAELSDNFQSGNLESDNSWDEIRAFIESKTEIIELDTEICSNAGRIKHEEREKYPDFGLMDSIILSSARKHNLNIITGDKHLKDMERTEKLQK